MRTAHERLREVRVAAGYSQVALAAEVSAVLGEDGFHQTYLSRIERGIRPPTVREALAIERVTGRIGKRPITVQEWL